MLRTFSQLSWSPWQRAASGAAQIRACFGRTAERIGQRRPSRPLRARAVHAPRSDLTTSATRRQVHTGGQERRRRSWHGTPPPARLGAGDAGAAAVAQTESGRTDAPAAVAVSTARAGACSALLQCSACPCAVMSAAAGGSLYPAGQSTGPDARNRTATRLDADQRRPHTILSGIRANHGNQGGCTCLCAVSMAALHSRHSRRLPLHSAPPCAGSRLAAPDGELDKLWD